MRRPPAVSSGAKKNVFFFEFFFDFPKRGLPWKALKLQGIFLASKNRFLSRLSKNETAVENIGKSKVNGGESPAQVSFDFDFALFIFQPVRLVRSLHSLLRSSFSNFFAFVTSQGRCVPGRPGRQHVRGGAGERAGADPHELRVAGPPRALPAGVPASLPRVERPREPPGPRARLRALQRLRPRRGALRGSGPEATRKSPLQEETRITVTGRKIRNIA